MKYVVDASVAVLWKLKDTDFERARRLRVAYENGVHELLAPETIIWETANVLLKAERQKNISAGDAELFYYDFLRTQPVLYPPATVRGPRVENRSSNTRWALRRLLCLARPAGAM
jgi:predicted nucleic acid-binding protein